jgi:hypothetical protein
MPGGIYAECHYAERRYVDCCGAIPFITVALSIKLFGAGVKTSVQ